MSEGRSGERKATGRREVLKLAGLGAVAGAAVAGAAPKAASAAEAAPAGRGYRETAHVKTYYQLARF